MTNENRSLNTDDLENVSGGYIVKHEPVCEICNIRFASMDELWKHQDEKHSGTVITGITKPKA